jgi:hypothetical protein
MVFGFGTNGRDAPPDTRALIVYADCGRSLGGSWYVGAGLRAYNWRTPGAADAQEVESSVRVARMPSTNGVFVFLDGSWTAQYVRTVLHVERPGSFRGFLVRPLVRLAWGRDLPFVLGFWPGGFDGFPGMKDGEARGDRELTAAVDLQRPMVGKFSLRSLVALGRTAIGGPLLPTGQWLLGARLGINWDTRFGLVRVEYGHATQGHSAFYIRLGRVL